MTRTFPIKSFPLRFTDPLSPQAIQLRLNFIGYDDCVRLSGEAKRAKRVEEHYRRVFKEAIYSMAGKALTDLADGDFDPDHYDFSPLIVNHAIDSMKAGLEKPRPVPYARLSAKKNPLSSIFEMWDRWRKGKLTNSQKRNAANIKRTFLHSVQEYWKKNSANFRRGDVYDMTGVKEGFVHAAKITTSRADMIVNTETTRYFNDSIVKIYDQADGVTHYLFVAIRDRRTTKWCTGYNKGGRDGLVYVKGDEVTRREQCPCHWNCRSQFLPLSPSNPIHLKLIQSAPRQRANNSPFPLPRGWNQ